MPKLLTGSPYQRFKQKWQDCMLCPYSQVRKNIVLCKGNIPCDVLFIGEAPGQSEDVLGKPFVGPAGKLLDRQIDEALRNAQRLCNDGDGHFDEVECDLRLCFTNLVCCIPKEQGKKLGEPSKEAIESCETRLIEFIHLCNPKLLVCVGDLAEKFAGWGSPAEVIKITHPAAILRAEIVRQSLMYQRVVVILEEAFREL